MENTQIVWKKWLPWIFAAIGFIVIVIIMIFALKGNGSGSGPNKNPPKASLGTPTMTKAVVGTTQPWRLWTKYAIAYVDTNGSGTHDGKADFCPNLHGVLSNVVAVQSNVNTNPSFNVTPAAGYDILVFRTQAKTVEDTVDSVADPVGKFSDCTTLTPGTSTETLIFTIKFSDKINNAFTDTSNPYSGPPSIQNVKYTKMTGSDPSKTPFRVPTYYKVQLSQGTTTGTPGNSTIPAVSTATPLEYGPIITFDGKLDSGQQTFAGGYTINVYYSSSATGPWTQFKSPMVFSQTDTNTISFTDLQNSLYVSPPQLSQYTPKISYVATPQGAQPWGYKTGFLFALSDYSNPGIPNVIGIPTTYVMSTYQPMATSYPVLKLADGVDFSLYYVVVYCSDNSADRTKDPIPSTVICDSIKGTISTTYSPTPLKNKYPGVSAAVVGSPAFTQNYNQLPFNTPIYIQATLTDFFNKYTLGPAVWSAISSKSQTTPITIPLTLSTSLPWTNYFDSTKTISIADLGLNYQFSSSTGTFQPLTNATLLLSPDSKTLTVTLTIANPYAGLPYAQDFQCNKWTNPDGTPSADCDDTCNGSPSDASFCCSENKWQPTPVGTVKNQNGSCPSKIIQNLKATDFAKNCSSKSYQSNLIVTKVDVDNEIYNGFCGSQCPLNWTLGNWGSPGTFSNVCSPVDSSAPELCSQWNNNFDNFKSTPNDCIGYGCEPIPSPSDGIKLCQADQDPSSQTDWTILNPPASSTSCPLEFPLEFQFEFNSKNRTGNVPGGAYTLCSKWKN